MPASARDLAAELDAIPAADVRTPDRPVEDVLNYAAIIAARIRAGRLGSNLKALRLPADCPDLITDVSSILLSAQGAYIEARNHRLPGGAAEAADRAAAYKRLRATLIFISGNDPTVVRTLSDATFDANPATAFALLASMFDSYAGDVLPSDGLDAAALVAEARELAAKTLKVKGDKAVAAPTTTSGVGSPRNTRDRAFTYLDTLLDTVRASAQFHFVDNPAAYRAFVADID